MNNVINQETICQKQVSKKTKWLRIVRFFVIMQVICACHVAKCSYRYDLAVCAIFKNEARFMKEWLEFYKLIGVQHFYLYNNHSKDEYLNILQPYIEKKEVDLVDWDNILAQSAAYDNAIAKTTGIVKWLIIVDLDEFLFPVQTNNLLDLLKDYEDYGGICANWVMYGTSDVECISSKSLMIEALTMCDHNFISDFCVKSIVRPERVIRMTGAHTALYKDGFFQVNSEKIKFEGSWAPSILLNKIRVNHYYTRDMKYLLEVKIASRIAFNAQAHEYKKQITIIEETIKQGRERNVEKDTAILKYADKLKIQMNY